MSITDKNRNAYDRYYRGLSVTKYEVQHKKSSFVSLMKALNLPFKNQKVVDIGFGFGEMLFQFDKSCEIYGVDLSSIAAQRATHIAERRNYRRFAFQALDLNSLGAKRLPYPDSFFDIVICSHTLEHVARDECVIKEICRILEREGVAIIMIPINESTDRADNLHCHTYTVDIIEAKLRKHGFLPAMSFVNGTSTVLLERLSNSPFLRWLPSYAQKAALLLFSTPFLISPRLADSFTKRLFWPTNLCLAAKKVNSTGSSWGER